MSVKYELTNKMTLVSENIGKHPHAQSEDHPAKLSVTQAATQATAQAATCPHPHSQAATHPAAPPQAQFASQRNEPNTPIVEVLTMQEFAQSTLGTEEAHNTLEALTSIESTYADALPEGFVGAFAIPNKRDPLDDPNCFAFYLDKLHLVFVDEGDICKHLLNAMATSSITKKMTPAHCLFEFMKRLTKDDLEYLAALEDRMEDEEEAMLDRGEETQDRNLQRFRRMLLRIDAYYQQLADMTSVFAENENKVLTHEESRLFSLLARQSERLIKRSQSLKEYSLQLRELYQTRIDIQQNDTIQWFTVITTLFAPLTLLTSWFGMNFKNMPGLDWPGAYYAVIGASLAITTGMLLFFKRKGWL